MKKVVVKDLSAGFELYHEALIKNVERYVAGLHAGMEACEKHKEMLLAKPHYRIAQASVPCIVSCVRWDNPLSSLLVMPPLPRPVRHMNALEPKLPYKLVLFDGMLALPPPSFPVCIAAVIVYASLLHRAQYTHVLELVLRRSL